MTSSSSSSSTNSLATRCGFVAVVGFPNAGKSTLVNALVGQKVSIVSHKVQTTRNRVMGIAVKENAQIVLMDTPGLLDNPQKRLEKAMLKSALETQKEGDLTLLVVDANHPSTERHTPLMDSFEALGIPVWIVLNKIDQLKREKLLIWADFFRAYSVVKNTFMISALTQDGTDDLFKALTQQMPESPWLFPEDQISTAPQRVLAAEITREVILKFLHQELPYVSYVETEAWEVFRNGSIKISQIIHVMKDGQKAIVLGHKGQSIKNLSTNARRELSTVFGTEIHLFLHVKVTPDWMERTHFYTMMGLTFGERDKK